MKIFVEKFYEQFGKITPEFLSRLDRNFSRLAAYRKLTVTIISANYTLVETDDVVVYTGIGGHTFTLPNPVAFVGYSFHVKHAGSGVLTISGSLFTTSLVTSVTTLTGDGIDFTAANAAWQIV